MGQAISKKDWKWSQTLGQQVFHAFAVVENVVDLRVVDAVLAVERVGQRVARVKIVVAALAEVSVVATLAPEAVGAGAAFHGVVAFAAVDPVLAGLAVEAVVAAVAG